MLGTALNRDDLDQEAPTRLDEPACETTLEPLLQIDQSERSIPGFPSSHKLDESSISPPPLAGLVFFQSIYFLSGLSASTWGRFAVIYYNQIKVFPKVSTALSDNDRSDKVFMMLVAR